MTRNDSAPGDELLLARIAAGSEVALAELYDRYGRLAFGLAFRVLRDRALAEDAVQEAFLAVWRSAAGFRPDRGAARAWVMSLVHRRAVDLVRREERQGREHLAHLGVAAVESSEEAAWLLAERRRIQDALGRLPQPLRRLLELAYYGGLTQSEIAARLDIPLGTVKGRTSAALDRLRRFLAEEEDAPDRATSHPQRPKRKALERVAAGA